jgi:hypothetical protein
MGEGAANRPYFLWDYNLTEDEVRKILRRENETEEIWLASRILESAKFEDIWQYLSLRDIKVLFLKLKLKPTVRRVWDYVLRVWEESEANGQPVYPIRGHAPTASLGRDGYIFP